MKLVILYFGILIMAVGALGLVSPPRLLAMVRWIRKPPGFAVAVVLRLTMGVLLLLGAHLCRFTLTLQILGAITILAAAGLLVIGPKRFARFIDSWMERPPAVIRGWLLLAAAFGAFLAYAAS